MLCNFILSMLLVLLWYLLFICGLYLMFVDVLVINIQYSIFTSIYVPKVQGVVCDILLLCRHMSFNLFFTFIIWPLTGYCTCIQFRIDTCPVQYFFYKMQRISLFAWYFEFTYQIKSFIKGWYKLIHIRFVKTNTYKIHTK